jgi:hypothetical protein
MAYAQRDERFSAIQKGVHGTLYGSSAENRRAKSVLPSAGLCHGLNQQGFGPKESGVRPTHFTFLCGVTRRWAQPTLPALAEAVPENRVVGGRLEDSSR